MHKEGIPTENKTRIGRAIIQAGIEAEFWHGRQLSEVSSRESGAQNKTSQTLFESRDVC